jgi:hypothetical protein
MDDEPTSIQCGEHGEASPTYVCGHLCRNPVQRWFCEPPSADYPHPDAWCASCNAELVNGGGEWTEHNSDCLDLKILCHRCYQDSMARSVEALDGKDKEAWINAVTDAHDALRQKQHALEAGFAISRHERWDYDQSAATLTFSSGGVAQVVADIEFIGSVSQATGTWLWAWANFHNTGKVVARIPAVREYGEENGFPHLTVPLWKGDATDGWEVSGIAAAVLGAQGVYRVPTPNGFLYMALMALRRVG